jgi:CRISPR-associated protein Cas1
MQLVLDTNGLVVKQRKRCFQVIGKEKQRLISPERVTSIAVSAECLLSAAAIRLAVEHGIPIFFFGPTGDIEGKLWSPYFVGMASLRRAQALWLESPDSLHWAVGLAEKKTSRQAGHLRELHKYPDLGEDLTQHLALLEAQCAELRQTNPLSANPDALRQRLLGLEGAAAKGYWAGLSAAVPTDWRFDGRSRRPAQDPFNAALNYLYGMLYPVVEQAVFAAGLDPYMGVLHAEEYDRPALTFDLIEPFRPWVDALLLRLCHENALSPQHFEPRDGGWWVGKAGKAVLIPRFNDFLLEERSEEGERRSVRNHIHAFAGSLAELLRDWYKARKQP